MSNPYTLTKAKAQRRRRHAMLHSGKSRFIRKKINMVGWDGSTNMEQLARVLLHLSACILVVSNSNITLDGGREQRQVSTPYGGKR